MTLSRVCAPIGCEAAPPLALPVEFLVVRLKGCEAAPPLALPAEFLVVRLNGCEAAPPLALPAEFLVVRLKGCEVAPPLALPVGGAARPVVSIGGDPPPTVHLNHTHTRCRMLLQNLYGRGVAQCLNVKPPIPNGLL